MNWSTKPNIGNIISYGRHKRCCSLKNYETKSVKFNLVGSQRFWRFKYERDLHVYIAQCMNACKTNVNGSYISCFFPQHGRPCRARFIDSLFRQVSTFVFEDLCLCFLLGFGDFLLFVR